uniref:Uncharacterized protein n=1 Tax=Wuchereria bancrofti TaxID=6293 RepID=A0A1I8EKW5_WUCBA
MLFSADLLYYMYFCACNFVSGLMPRPLAKILNIIVSVFRFIICCKFLVCHYWNISKSGTFQQEVQLGSTSCEFFKQENEFQSFRAPFRETIWCSQLTSSNSLANKLGQSFINI